MMKLSMLFLYAGVLQAQPFTFGIKGGVRLTSDLDSYFATTESKQYVVGPMLTARLPFGFRLELDALYRRVGYRTASSDVLGGFYSERDVGNAWEVPMVLRRTLWHGFYAGAGYAPRIINGARHFNSVSVTSLNPLLKSYYESSLPGSWNTTHGVIGAAGIEKRVGPLRIAPEIRYTHWNKPAVDLYGSHGFSIQSSQNQVDLMIGISFP